MKFLVEDVLKDAEKEKEDLKREKDLELNSPDRLRLVILGAGGGGGNTINRLSRIGITKGVELIAVNTDAQDLKKLDQGITKVLIGQKLTRGLGAGGFVEVGERAAEESKPELEKLLAGTDLIFLTAGMGGGTGTGSLPVIAEIAKDAGAIVVAFVTFPFMMERSRLDKARQGIDNLRKVADTIIIIDNNLLVKYFSNLAIDKAFLVADEIVSRAVKGITDTIYEPSLINLDFADIKSVLGGGKISVISVGDGEGPERVNLAVKNTLAHPLLDVDYKGATGALIHITGGEDMTIGDANKIGELITKEMDPNANVTWGARVNKNMKDKYEVICIMTGVKSPHILGSSLRDVGSAYVYTKEIDQWGISSI
ncbi:MAG: cell division protein FtsZ [Candidatus Altiarchaeota archaeon]